MDPSTSLAKTARIPPLVAVKPEVTGREKLIVPERPERSTWTSLFSTLPIGLALEPLFGVR